MYQYLTPRAWGHAVSADLVHWTQLPVALATDMPYDRGGVYSGSATVLDDDARTPMLSYSVSTNDMMCLAFPANRSDPDLVVWTKYVGNPVISVRTGAPPGRDPTTAWRSASGGTWRMAYGTDQGAVVYTTADLKTWTKTGMLNSGDRTGMWECPDFFAVPGTRGSLYLLKASTLGRDYWALGTYDDVAVRFTPSSLDIGTFSQVGECVCVCVLVVCFCLLVSSLYSTSYMTTADSMPARLSTIPSTTARCVTCTC